jgi:hypothetical protein
MIGAVFTNIQRGLVATHLGGRCELRPSRALIVAELVLHFGFGAGCVALGALGLPLLVSGEVLVLVVCGPPLALGLFILYRGLRLWRESLRALVVEPDGRVLYGAHELCGPGEATAVRVVRCPAKEGEDSWRLGLVLPGGRAVALPARYFFLFSSREWARRAANALAKALGAEVREDE